MGAGRSRLVQASRFGIACAIPLLVGACDLFKKDAPSPAGADASTAAAPSRAPSIPDRFDRRYAGTIGADLKATMHLVRNGDKLSGTYAYVRVGRDLVLSGSVTTTGDVSMQESVDGATSSEFKGKLTGAGSLVGTWSTPNGAKKLPFEFKESSDASAAPNKAGRKPVAPAGPTEWVTLYSTIASMNGVSVTQAEVESAVKNGYPSPEFQRKIKAPYTDIASLYFADINNDGAFEYVLCDTNSVGLHNSHVVAVYRPHNAVMVDVPLPAGPPFDKQVAYLGGPFLSVDAEGTTMTFSEDSGTERYLWTGTKVRLLDRTAAKKP